MAKRCEICGKGPVVGRNISHAHNVTPRRFEPNLQRVRALVNGGIRRLRVCTRCLRSNKVEARDRKLGLEEMRGGTFTISNQGGIGGGHFTPIINRPEVAILGLGRSVLKPVVREGKIEARLMMPITIAYDHRVIDGGAAARFTVDLVNAFQSFAEQDVKI
jgi:ribosomal protein L28